MSATPATPLQANPASSVDCLATVLESEAKGEDLKGKLLVAAVVVNRLEKSGFPSTICGVIHDPGQFNTTPARVTSDSYAIASLVLEGELTLPATTALYFHSGKKPSYLAGKTFLFQHGGHYFYE